MSSRVMSELSAHEQTYHVFDLTYSPPVSTTPHASQPIYSTGLLGILGSVSGPFGGWDGAAYGFGRSLSLGSLLRCSVRIKNDSELRMTIPPSMNGLGPLRGGRGGVGSGFGLDMVRTSRVGEC